MLPPLPAAPKLPKVGRKAKAIAAELARRFARWSEDNRDRVRATIDEVADGDEDGNATYVVPDDLRARAADKWTPFFILAHLARGTWPARVREAWRALQSAKGLTELDLGVQLLIACRDIFAQDPREHWSPTELRGKLIADESAIWAEMPKTGKPLSTNMMARLLKRHGIQITEKRTGTSNARIDRPRGYRVTDFREPFARQLRPGRIPEDLVTSDSDVATSGSAPEERSDPLETWVSSENTGPSASEWRDSGTTVTPQGLSAFQMAGQAEDLSRQLEPEKPNIFSDVPLSRHLGEGSPCMEPNSADCGDEGETEQTLPTGQSPRGRLL